MSLSVVGGTLTTVGGTLPGGGSPAPAPDPSHRWLASEYTGIQFPDTGTVGTAPLRVDGAGIEVRPDEVLIPGNGDELCGVTGQSSVLVGLEDFSLVVVATGPPAAAVQFLLGLSNFNFTWNDGYLRLETTEVPVSSSGPEPWADYAVPFAAYVTRVAPNTLRFGVVGGLERSHTWADPVSLPGSFNHNIYIGYGEGSGLTWHSSALFIGSVLTDEQIAQVAADLGL